MNEKTIKICLLTFNIACLFVGLATLIVGIVLYSLPTIQIALQSVAENVSETQISLLSILMMSIGGLITFISIVGCCGAMNESKCMIGVYCIVLFLLFIGQLTVGILGFVYKDQILDFSENFQRLVNTRSPTLKAVEETFNCCGYNGPQDYDSRYNRSVDSTPSVNATTVSSLTESTAFPTTSPAVGTDANSTMQTYKSSTSVVGNVTESTIGLTMTTQAYVVVSESCCKRNATGIVNIQMCQDPSVTDFQLYVKTNGCKNEIIDFIQRYELIIGAVSISFAVLELLALIAGCRLFTTLD